MNDKAIFLTNITLLDLVMVKVLGMIQKLNLWMILRIYMSLSLS
jgi:hypothetical protein